MTYAQEIALRNSLFASQEYNVVQLAELSQDRAVNYVRNCTGCSQEQASQTVDEILN